MFLARFSLALVLSVSMGVVQGRAVVMVVSRWPASVAVEVSLVASSRRGCVLCAKKFSLRAHNGPKLVFSGVLGEFFAGTWLEGMCRVKFFANQQSCDPVGRTLLRRSLGSRPLYWQC